MSARNVKLPAGAEHPPEAEPYHLVSFYGRLVIHFERYVRGYTEGGPICGASAPGGWYDASSSTEYARTYCGRCIEAARAALAKETS
jgi:hypothetical protein